MNILEVEGLCKTYPAFALRDVSFAVEPGTIMGFIGRNGAGKSTTIKSMLNLVHPDSGRVTMFGQDFYANEPACKQQLGVVLGGVSGYFGGTLDIIMNFLSEQSDYVTANEIAEGTGLAYQTVYRYLQHLVQDKKVERVDVYGKVGRPKQVFRRL